MLNVRTPNSKAQSRREHAGYWFSSAANGMRIAHHASCIRDSASSIRDQGSALRLLALFMLLAACHHSAAEPKFADLPPELQPATNLANASATTASNAQKTAGGAASQVPTNVARVASINSMDALDDKHRLANGDQLSFRIIEDEEDPKPLLVTDSGELEIPYIGRFPAVGKSCKELARSLKAELEKEYYYQATVIIAVNVMAKSRGKVYLVGPVHAPGPQEVPSDEILTLSKAILRAGGFNDFADRHNVRVTRKGGGSGTEDQSYTINVAEILDRGKSEADLPLEPGDLVYIPERLIRF